jgi:hypothetical protein
LLRDEPPHWATDESAAITPRASGRRQDYVGSVIDFGEYARDFEAVHSWQLHIEENDVWMVRGDEGERAYCICRLTGDTESFAREQFTDHRTKLIVVIDDEQARSHLLRMHE